MLRSIMNNKSVGIHTFNSPKVYPVGRQLWNIRGDVCNNDGQYQQENLTLTVCTEGQFTCDNGECVDIEQVISCPLEKNQDWKGTCRMFLCISSVFPQIFKYRTHTSLI